MTSMPNFLERLAGIVGAANILTDSADTAPFLNDWRGRYRGAAQCVVRPGNVAQLAALVKVCAAAGVPMVPQGGNTSLCGGATPDETGRAVLISLGRLNRILSVDAQNNTISVEAGCTLAAVQAAANAVERLFPLALASEGSCQIGGNLSTNAGGVQVLRYGNARDLTLGLQVVLPNGDLWDGLRSLRKDNTGYDLKQLFIGAEGTLGIITAAVLKLYPLPYKRITCWLNIASPAAAVDVLNEAKNSFDAQLTAFELISGTTFGLLVRHIPGSVHPCSISPWYVLLEFSDAEVFAVQHWLNELIIDDKVGDAVVASNPAQAKKLWALRENISEAQKIEGISIKHDVAVPVSSIPKFLNTAGAALAAVFPGIRVITFGHVGDGNLHYNLSFRDAESNALLLTRQAEVSRIVHDTVHAFNGSVSAEHGLGQLKREEILRYKSPVEMGLMRSIKQTLDPHDLMNPGKLL